jgi:hypothetical protein
MAFTKRSESYVAAVAGIAGALIGAVATSLVNAHIEDQRRRADAALESFKFDQGNYPVEFIQIKQMLDEMRNLSVESGKTINRLAVIARKYPSCGNSLSDSCFPAYVEIVKANREEIGAGYASDEDIRDVLRIKFGIARAAFDRLKDNQ